LVPSLLVVLRQAGCSVAQLYRRAASGRCAYGELSHDHLGSTPAKNAADIAKSVQSKLSTR
jgi:hypothetical protein